MTEVTIDRDTRAFLVQHFAEHAFRYEAMRKRNAQRAEWLKSKVFYDAHLEVLSVLGVMPPDADALKAALDAWFRARFEQASEALSYESAEGGYQFIAGPEVTGDDMREALTEAFEERCPAAVVDEVLSDLDDEGPWFDPEQWG